MFSQMEGHPKSLLIYLTLDSSPSSLSVWQLKITNMHSVK